MFEKWKHKKKIRCLGMKEWDLLTDWSKVKEFGVGGLLYVGFSNKQTNKLVCISSEYMSVVDCDTGEKIKCEGDYDETDYTAVSSYFPDEVIGIYGQYGGFPLLDTDKGEKISIENQNEICGNKTLVKTKVILYLPDEEVEIFNCYGFYVCSFSPCGNYFVFLNDGGVVILKREDK